jgi:hypothetical protein
MLTIDKKQYAQITVNGKTGTRNIPLFSSIPFIKDWLSSSAGGHPTPGNPNSYLIPSMDTKHHATHGHHMQSMNNNNNTADFSANFTMIRPDGSLSHGHVIKNFTSDNVILAENDIIVTGITDIYFNNNSTLEYNQVPITVHLMGRKVLGLMINAEKTGRHFANSNELFGTLISGTGLEDTGLQDTQLFLQNDKNNNNKMEMDEMMTMRMPHS